MANPLEVPTDPEQAVERLRTASRDRTVLVFKRSPICPVSGDAERRYDAWLARQADTTSVVVDVVAQRALARGLTAALGIRHESPQVLLFHGGELRWHASHWEITEEALEEARRALPPA